MAKIPLAEIPNAPMGGKPALANPQFPRDEVGGQAISQLREGYSNTMVDERVTGAMGRAYQNLGGNLTQIGLQGMDASIAFSRLAEKDATGQFLLNLTQVQGGMKEQMAGADPSMYPVIVKNTYRDKNGNLNPALFSGVSPQGRRYIEADALRAEAKDMAEYSLQAHLATLERDEGNKLAAMQTMMTSGNYGDAETMNESLFATRRISANQYANNKVQIAGARDNATLLAAINADPVAMGQKLSTAYAEGKPITEVSNISLESYPRYIKAAEIAHSIQSTEQLTTMAELVDGKALLTLDALRGHPLYEQLDGKMKVALERRLTNSTGGTPVAEASIKAGYNKVAAFPSTDTPSKEFMELATYAVENLPDPFLEPFMQKLNGKLDEMAQNGGVLAPKSKLESYVAQKLDLIASIGVFGEVPEKDKGNAQTPDFAQKTLAIENEKMRILEKFRAAGIRNQADADQFVNEQILPAQAKNAFKEQGGFGTKFRNFFLGKPDPNKPTDTEPRPAKTPTPTGNEVSMFDPDVTDLVAGPATFKVTDQTREALPASTPTARQVSLDFNDAASPTARGVEIIIPNDATDEERAIAQAYVDRTTEWFRSKGIDVPNRGVRTAKENGRGTRGRFHTEPFFVGDAEALEAMQSDPQGYAQILASTLGRISGVTFIAPHTAKDPGAGRGNINERDFAKSVIIPELQKLANS
jgi:hypothetical protein